MLAQRSQRLMLINSVSGLSRKYDILDVSQLCGPVLFSIEMIYQMRITKAQVRKNGGFHSPESLHAEFEQVSKMRSPVLQKAEDGSGPYISISESCDCQVTDVEDRHSLLPPLKFARQKARMKRGRVGRMRRMAACRSASHAYTASRSSGLCEVTLDLETAHSAGGTDVETS